MQNTRYKGVIYVQLNSYHILSILSILYIHPCPVYVRDAFRWYTFQMKSAQNLQLPGNARDCNYNHVTRTLVKNFHNSAAANNTGATSEDTAPAQVGIAIATLLLIVCCCVGRLCRFFLGACVVLLWVLALFLHEQSPSHGKSQSHQRLLIPVLSAFASAFTASLVTIGLCIRLL